MSATRAAQHAVVPPTKGDAPSPFTDAGVLWAWDSTLLDLYKTCSRKFFLMQVEGWRPRGEVSVLTPLTFGIMLHSALEAWDRAKIEQGMEHEEATKFALAEAWRLSAGHATPDSRRTRNTLLRTILWYTEQFRDDRFETIKFRNGKAAIEVSFRISLPVTTPDGRSYILSGHIDRLGRFGEGIYVLDRKHTVHALDAKYWAQYNPNGQMKQYALGGKVLLGEDIEGVVIDAAQVGVDFTRFERYPLSLREDHLDEYLEDTITWIKKAERDATDGRWPMNERSCHQYGGCQFRGICALSPVIRRQYLQGNFVQLPPWNPLQSRGD